MRKLATIRKIKEVRPIDGADKIELALIDGWQVVIREGEFKVGDKVVYLEVDSFLPIKPQYEFLRKSSYKVMADGTEGFRLRTVKLRGQISQGLLLPLSEISSDTPIATDVSDVLGIRKYEAPIPACISGEVTGKIPGQIRVTDQERIQNLIEYFQTYSEESFEASEKLDGTSMTIYHADGELGVCGHHWVYAESERQTLWKIARKLNIPDRLKGRNLALQGECIGEGIQKNHYKLTGQDWFIFDIWDIDNGRYLTPAERGETLKELNTGVPEHLKIRSVPIIEESIKIFEQCKDLNSLLEYASGVSGLEKSVRREGVVFKSCNIVIDSGIVSFKAISNIFLLDEKE